MTNRLKFAFLLSCIAILFLSSACTDSESMRNNSSAARFASSDVYADVLYFCDIENNKSNYNIFYQILPANTTNTTSTVSEKQIRHLCSNPICSHDTDSCPSFLRTDMHSIAIDRNTSLDSPIIYISDNNQIKSYNISDDKLKLIKTYDDGYPIALWLYDEWIFSAYSCGEDIQLRRIDKDGKNEIIFSRNESDVSFRIIGFDDNFLYYADFLSGYYRVDHNLTNEEFLFSTNCFLNGYVLDGFLYYCNDLSSETLDNTKFEFCSLYRYDLNKLNQQEHNYQPELIDREILVSLTPMVFRAENMIFYCKYTPKKLGENVFKDDSNNDIVVDVWQAGASSLYMYTPNTSEIQILHNDIGYDLARFHYATDNYVLFDGAKYYQKSDGLWYRSRNTILYNYIENTITLLD